MRFFDLNLKSLKCHTPLLLLKEMAYELRENSLLQGAMTRLTARIEERTLSSVASVFAESEYTLRLLAPHVNPARLHLAPPGVDTNFFCPDSSFRKDGYLIAVGRFQDPRKNV